MNGVLAFDDGWDIYSLRRESPGRHDLFAVSLHFIDCHVDGWHNQV